MYLDRVLVLQKSVGLADRGTTYIIGEEQRQILKDDERKKGTIHEQNWSTSERQRFLSDHLKGSGYKTSP